MIARTTSAALIAPPVHEDHMRNPAGNTEFVAR
jgi:hypothetical protein